MDGELLSGWPPERAEQFRKLCDTHTNPTFHPFGSELAERISGLLPLFRRQSDHMEDYFFAYALEPLVRTVAVVSTGRPSLAHKIFRELGTWLLVPETISAHGGWYQYQGRSIPATYLDKGPASTLEGAVGELERGEKVVLGFFLLDEADRYKDGSFVPYERLGSELMEELHRQGEKQLRGKKRVDEYALRRVFDFTCLLRELGDLHAAVRLSDYTPAEKDAFYDLFTHRDSLISSASIGRLSTLRMLIESGEVDTLDQVLKLAWKKSQNPSFDVFVENLELKGESVRVINVDDDAAVLRFLGTLTKSEDFSSVALQKGGVRYDLPYVLSPIINPAYELRRSIEAKIQDTLEKAGIVLGRDCDLKERLKTPASVTFKLLSTQRMPYEERSGAKIDDTIGIRMLGRSEEMCRRIYAILGHAYEVMVVNDFFDVKKQKQNGYRSLDFYLHVNGLPVHVQVRTREMEEVNEYGSASHYVRKYIEMDKFLKKLNQNPNVFVSFFQRLAASFITGFEKAQRTQLGSLSYRQIRELYRV